MHIQSIIEGALSYTKNGNGIVNQKDMKSFGKTEDWTHGRILKSMDREVYIRNADEDYGEEIGELLYYTDPYIYPDAFGSAENAKRLFPCMMKKHKGIFSSENIYVAELNNTIVGIIIAFDFGSINNVSYKDIGRQLIDIPSKFDKVCTEYFEKIPFYAEPNTAYILALSVLSKYRESGVGQRLLQEVLEVFSYHSIKLHVLTSNISAIKLYKRNGFYIREIESGYSSTDDKEDCYCMIRSTMKKEEGR